MDESLRELLADGRIDEIGELAVRRKRLLGSLIALTYDPDPLTGWRAVEALGVAAERVAEHAPEFVREHLRRLYWLISEESGGICWRAPEAMAEIVRRRPEEFADYIPIVVFIIRNLAEEDRGHFLAGCLWAIGRVAPVAGRHLAEVLSDVVAALEDGNSQVRGLAVWCLGQAGRPEFVADRPDLLSDEGTAALYENGVLGRTKVCELARRALGE